MRHHCIGANNDIVTKRYSWHYAHIVTNPNILSNGYRFTMDRTLTWRNAYVVLGNITMIMVCNKHFAGTHGSRTDGNSLSTPHMTPIFKCDVITDNQFRRFIVEMTDRFYAKPFASNKPVSKYNMFSSTNKRIWTKITTFTKMLEQSFKALFFLYFFLQFYILQVGIKETEDMVHNLSNQTFHISMFYNNLIIVFLYFHLCVSP